MRVTRTSPKSFAVEFETEEELREEHRIALKAGGLRLPIGEKLAPFTALEVELSLRGRGSARAVASVVAPLPQGIALALEGNMEKLMESLLFAPALEVAGQTEAEPPVPPEQRSVWDRLRSLSRLEKLLLAPKADRVERAILAQDNDPQVLYTLLKNPRLTVDEVIRIAKSPFLTYQTVEVIMKSTQWLANLEVRVALIHNPKTPPLFAIRILPTLPESEVRTISRGAATSQLLKQAALKRLQGQS